MTQDPLRLFWWNRIRNFGDRISADIVRSVSGRVVERAMPPDADLFAVGSILTPAFQSLGRRRNPMKPVIWGTGLMGSAPAESPDRLHFAAVRGPLTQALLDLPPLALGDPGVLVRDLFKDAPERGDRLGIVLHHSQKPDPDLKARLLADGRFFFIDVMARDHLGVVRQIAECRHVFSSSLHGLIVADAFGVPNTWLDASGIHASPGFKFHDYALGVRRLLNLPIPLEDICTVADALPAGCVEIDHAPGVEASRRALREAFPHRILERHPEPVAELAGQ